ncbi:hypothetical protein [Crocosphaera sp.]|uniref:hypothetical protein n=1 Tax=Crocosphaera sp. TaxID=2729996 RepID=UPI002603B247|nr:hypothetical protein [Crocosphaera sp.]MDJ0581600.1 hypothetical protein [Crocosphaera sp.]
MIMQKMSDFHLKLPRKNQKNNSDFLRILSLNIVSFVLIFSSFILFPFSALAVTNSELIPSPELANKPTGGIAIPVLCNPDFQECEKSVQLLGTINNNRGRWNPFLPENNMIKDGDSYYKQVELKADGGRHHDGIYALRFVKNHDLYKTFKADHTQLTNSGKPQLVRGEKANEAQNIIIKVDESRLYEISFNAKKGNYKITPKPTYLTEINSMQLNGFVWDEEDMFEKFDETRPNHEMTQNGDTWEITVPLKTTGGIDFRADGVYQFLFSANNNEDWGFGAYNDGEKTLTGGTGFGSSGGESKHSAITIQVFADGDYTFKIDPLTYKFDVIPPDGVESPKFWNDINSFQLLGTFYENDQFDPTIPEYNLEEIEDNIWTKKLSLEPGIYGSNIAISGELFLDTMALGAWLESDNPNKLIGKNWHGKPNEPNIFFEVTEPGDYQFTYDANRDQFSLESLDNIPWQPLVTIDSLQLVGSFDEPLTPWDPTSTANNMEQTNNSIFTTTVNLEANREYNYKYTANNWPWLWVFSDYELDEYGHDFLGSNPDPIHSRLEDLETYGQLTTHGDPPPLAFTPTESGCYRFTANLESGAYSLQSTDEDDCK